MGLKRNCIEEFITRAKEEHGIGPLTRSQVQSIKNKYKLSVPSNLFKTCKISRGLFDLSMLNTIPKVTRKVIEFHPENESDDKQQSIYSLVSPHNSDYTNNLIPLKDKNYVKWGNYKDVKKVIDSKIFAPVFITGLSGNGKTMMVEQVCASTKREYIRVNITIETDEDDLMGGFRLVDGETKWFDGPVSLAMQRGAVLLLDEIDLGGNRLMCLQPVLEGKPVYLKKINKWIFPIEGFTILATANTKGKSDDTGNFIGTNIMNEAFLDRFKFTMFQKYPNKSIEKLILTKISNKYGLDAGSEEEIEEVKGFIEKLILWAHGSRQSYNDGVLDEVITTRRLVNIIEAYKIFKSKEKSIKMCLERFDDHTKEAYLDFYKKLDDDIDPFNEQQTLDQEEEDEDKDDDID